ncbi:hypothetical protein ACFQY0_20000 [Haloferula chungangensis]|uniref:Uncharacterized protein n=1 Tax=Haloferula chungangensis TaxID=1048331 RepID=A0ABW2LFC7_9BACT
MDLKWPAGEDSDLGDGTTLSFRLEEKTAASEWQSRYEGPDRSSVRTGMAEGLHEFRVLDLSKNLYSETLSVEVRYMDAGRVRLLLISGGIVVLATIIAILHGHLNHGKERDA